MTLQSGSDKNNSLRYITNLPILVPSLLINILSSDFSTSSPFYIYEWLLIIIFHVIVVFNQVHQNPIQFLFNFDELDWIQQYSPRKRCDIQVIVSQKSKKYSLIFFHFIKVLCSHFAILKLWFLWSKYVN